MANDLLSKIVIGGVTYDIKDAEGRLATATVATNLQAEINRATIAEATISANLAAETVTRKSADDALDERIKNLEARGRFLSSWNVTTGKPGDYPDPGTGTSFTYEYKTGDYYIVSAVPESGTKYKPDGTEITASKSGETWTWTVPTAEETGTVAVGDEYLYTKTGWVLIHTEQKQTVWGGIGGTLSNQTDLKNALDAKLGTGAQVAGVAFTGTIPNVETAALQTALGLEDLAYSATASGEYTPKGVISTVSFTPEGTVTLNDFGTATATAVLTTVSYTPAGNVTGSVIALGSVASEATLADEAASLSYATVDITPKGTISKVEFTPSGSITATIAYTSTSASVTKDYYTPGGTIDFSKFTQTETAAVCTTVEYTPAGNITLNALSQVNTTATLGYTDYTPAGSVSVELKDNQASKITDAGTAASWSGYGFTAASLTDATSSAFNTDAIKATVNVATETLEFLAASTANAVTDRGTFTASTINWGTFNGGSVPTFTAVTVAVNAATFSGTKFTAMVNSVTYSKAEQNGGTFTGTAASDKFVTGVKYDKLTAIGDGAFIGTSAQINVSGVKYDKADEHPTAKFAGDAMSATPTFFGTASSITHVSGASYKKVTAVTSTFTGSSANISASFSGTAAANGWVTKVEYDKTTTGTASFTGKAVSVQPTFAGTKETISVTPDTVTVE